MENVVFIDLFVSQQSTVPCNLLYKKCILLMSQSGVGTGSGNRTEKRDIFRGTELRNKVFDSVLENNRYFKIMGTGLITLFYVLVSFYQSHKIRKKAPMQSPHCHSDACQLKIFASVCACYLPLPVYSKHA